jgi:hypothetical protein
MAEQSGRPEVDSVVIEEDRTISLWRSSLCFRFGRRGTKADLVDMATPTLA